MRTAWCCSATALVEEEGTPQEMASHLTVDSTERSGEIRPRSGLRSGLEAEGVFDVLAGGAEDLAVHVDQAAPAERPAMPSLPSDRPGDGISPRIPDPLVQIEVADGMRDDGRAEHLLLLLLDELPQVHVGIGERRRIRGELRLDQSEGTPDVTLPVEADTVERTTPPSSNRNAQKERSSSDPRTTIRSHVGA